ncbi:TetR family transcriptional regulator [Aeribacillus composti]|uniref:TetR/AcrR family transcriptional regulator n=1 Tax=Aeribacillus composti TaxID=1868734 RepID=UPI00119ADD27|nr:TetR/AcrR family transcriptional regulator [Aeribacillus composti]TVZ86908.1 TetR family transcriptional regulator [Aeribacillus composti]
MKEKERLIIEAAMKLFARKGVSSTSIQEITNACGIPKGSFYFYFKSKDELLIKLLEQFFSQLKKKTEQIGANYENPKERFIKQLSVQLKEFLAHKEIFITQMHENLKENNEKIDSLLQNLRNDFFHFLTNNLKNIYGKSIDKYIADVNIIVQGIFFSFIQFLIFENRVRVDEEKLAKYILQTADDLVKGMLAKQNDPIIPAEIMTKMFNHPQSPSHPLNILNEIKEMSRSIIDDGQLNITIEVLEAEITAEKPRTPVIKGMLSNLHEYPELRYLANQLADYFQIK